MKEFQARLDDVRKKRLEERRKERILERKVQRRIEREEKERKEKEEREKRGKTCYFYLYHRVTMRQIPIRHRKFELCAVLISLG